MANKPFEIQSSTLTIGGVDLQAGTTGVVIPGVTRATNYRVEEVDSDDNDQTVLFEIAPVIIDHVTFTAYNNGGSYSLRATYTAELDDDGYIDEINVDTGGYYSSADRTINESQMMLAYSGPLTGEDMFIYWTTGDWTTIPFRPKMRAGEIETIGGGGGSGNQLVETDEGNTFALTDTGDVVFDGEGPGGVDRGLVWQYGDNNNGINSMVRQDEGGITVRAYTTNGGTGAGSGEDSGYSAPVNIVTGQNSNQKTWTFDGDGALTFPDGTVQTTAYTGQTNGGSSTGELYIMANIDGNIVTSTNGIDWNDPQPSGMAGINRVEVHGGVIVYIPGNEGPEEPGLYYSTQLGTATLCAGTAVSVETGDNLYWRQVRYFSGTDKWVAVGYNAGGTNNFPVVAHSDDGIDWTVVFADNTFVTGFNTDNGNWQLNDVAWVDETNQYIITSSLSGLEVYGGIFLTSDITTALDGSNHVAINFNSNEVAPWSVVGFGGPPGYVVLMSYNDGPPGSGGDAVWFGWGTGVENYALEDGWWSEPIISEIGYLPYISEVAYRNGNFIAVTTAGHVITPSTVVGPGPGYIISIPLPFTNTTFSITNANPAVISWNDSNSASNNEKIEVTLAGEYNGTYYVNSDTNVLYTDLAMTTALDASGFASFTTGTVTFSHGQYFDAAGVSNSYYYIGNDDEQIFRSSNGITWTQQADLTGEYFNDFAYGTFGTSATSTAIPNTKRGWINLVGDKPNNGDDAAFESVVVQGDYAYVLGSDYYIDNSNGRAKVYKFDVRTGEQVWVKQITAGRNATFDLTISAGVVTIDALNAVGVGYKAGEEIVIRGNQIAGSDPQNNVTIIANSVDGSGGVVTASVKPGYNVTGITQTLTGIASDYDDARGDVSSITYNDFNGKLVVVAEYRSGRGDTMDGEWQWANIYTMDPTTGAIESTTTLSDEGDIYPNSVATFNASGKVAVVGEKYNEYREFGALTIQTPGVGYFDILKTELDAEHYPGSQFDYYGDFWITGTGITVQENVDAVNYYNNLATTVRQGSGAVFEIGDNGLGSYTASGIQSNGTNYLPGHKIKILGTALGGATPANDCIITVDSISEGGAIFQWSVAGTAAGSVYALYTPVTGTNYNVGSGATFTLSVSPLDGSFSYNGISNQGLNYVAGDVLTVSGTAFAGGTSPANDATLIVEFVGGSGEIGNILYGQATGTGPTTAIRVRVDGVDFTVAEGAWSMRQNLGGEAFVWTPDWSNTIGGPSGDRFYDVTWSNDGSAVYAVGRGRYETTYDQALVVKFDAADGSIVWSKDIKFEEATDNYRQARAVCLVPNSDDIIVGGEWYNDDVNRDEMILTRITSAGAAVWQKTYGLEAEGGEQGLNSEINLKAVGGNIVLSFEQNTNNNNGLAYLVINPADGTVIRHRVVSADGNSNYNYYNTPTAKWADVYSDATGDYVVMAGYTYVPTDNYYNALLMKLPLDGLVDIAIDERWSLGEHIMNRHTVNVTTMTSAFDSFTATEHIDTITNTVDARNYTTRAPDGLLHVWTHKITDDAAGYLEFGDGSRQSFATNIIPQIPAANDYWLTAQDSGKHIFFEYENGAVYIPHSSVRYFPVGFTFTIVNTTGSNCSLIAQNGPWTRASFKLSGRNITTPEVGIPDSGSGSMITVMKIKDGYSMTNSDNNQDYADVWIVSGPDDLYDSW